jgi:5-aminolevulinate synthase
MWLSFLMLSYDTFFQTSLDTLKKEGRYRTFVQLKKIPNAFPRVLYCKGPLQKEVTIWCSNDYLGMGMHPSVLERMHQSIDQDGAGSGGTRNIGGTHHWHVKLEQELADLHQKDASLLFTSGYVANEATLATLGRHLPHCIIFSDKQNHASMIHGVRYSGAEKRIFRHNDLDHLETLLKEAPPHASKVIAFESVYSMGGDIAPIEKICDLAEKYNALTFVDEVHAVGLYGPQGGGIADRDNLSHRISVICANFGKTVGVMGGYIAGNHHLVDFIRSFASPFIFTTSLPPVICAGVLASIQFLKRSQLERSQMHENVRILKEKLRKMPIEFLDSDSHIVPLMVRDAALCKQISDELLETHSIYVQPINYPTVPKGQERLRITVTPFHTERMIDDFLESLWSVWKKFNLTPSLKSHA